MGARERGGGGGGAVWLCDSLTGQSICNNLSISLQQLYMGTSSGGDAAGVHFFSWIGIT
jgi:hypothetical protein